MKLFAASLLSLGIMLSAYTLEAANTYKLDTTHSSVSFEISHLVISTVKGRFDTFDGSITTDENGNLTGVNGTIKASSINTNEKKRDDHLRSKDFFHVDKHPELNFQSTKVKIKPGREARMKGNMTIHGVTKPVTFKVDYKGLVTDPWGNKKAIFDAETEIDRKDFGLTWNKNLDQGGVMIGEEVDIELNIQANLVEEKKKETKTSKK